MNIYPQYQVCARIDAEEAIFFAHYTTNEWVMLNAKELRALQPFIRIDDSFVVVSGNL